MTGREGRQVRGAGRKQQVSLVQPPHRHSRCYQWWSLVTTPSSPPLSPPSFSPPLHPSHSSPFLPSVSSPQPFHTSLALLCYLSFTFHCTVSCLHFSFYSILFLCVLFFPRSSRSSSPSTHCLSFCLLFPFSLCLFLTSVPR